MVCVSDEQGNVVIRRQLGRVEAMNLSDLEERTGIARDDLARELERMAETRVVEAIRPTCERAEFVRHRTYWRLIRRSDGEHRHAEEATFRRDMEGISLQRRAEEMALAEEGPAARRYLAHRALGCL